MGEGRHIFSGQRIHGSLLYEINKEEGSCYEPKASLEYLTALDPRSWKHLFTLKHGGTFVEPDPYQLAVELSRHLTSYSTVEQAGAGSDLLKRFQEMVDSGTHSHSTESFAQRLTSLLSAINARALLEVPEFPDLLQAGGCLPPDVQRYALRTYQRLRGVAHLNGYCEAININR